MLVFPWFFFAVWPGGRRCANCRDKHFLRGTVMKASSHEKHAKQQWKNKKKKKKKSSDPWARSGERPGRGHGSELFLFFFFFGFSMVFCSLAKTSRKPTKKTKKTKSQTHGQGLGYPHTNQKTKKTKNQKKQKKTRLHTPRGGGQMQSVGSCLFVFFVFLFFWFVCGSPLQMCQAEIARHCQWLH